MISDSLIKNIDGHSTGSFINCGFMYYTCVRDSDAENIRNHFFAAEYLIAV